VECFFFSVGSGTIRCFSFFVSLLAIAHSFLPELTLPERWGRPFVFFLLRRTSKNAGKTSERFESFLFLLDPLASRLFHALFVFPSLILASSRRNRVGVVLGSSSWRFFAGCLFFFFFLGTPTNPDEIGKDLRYSSRSVFFFSFYAILFGLLRARFITRVHALPTTVTHKHTYVHANNWREELLNGWHSYFNFLGCETSNSARHDSMRFSTSASFWWPIHFARTPRDLSNRIQLGVPCSLFVANVSPIRAC